MPVGPVCPQVSLGGKGAQAPALRCSPPAKLSHTERDTEDVRFWNQNRRTESHSFHLSSAPGAGAGASTVVAYLFLIAGLSFTFYRCKFREV